jgi:hypothetical protein
MPEEQKCRVCGCTENNACVTPSGPCFWVEQDLCSNTDCLKAAHGFTLNADTLNALSMPVHVEIDVAGALYLIATIQLACRYPGFGGAARVFCEDWARNLQRTISLTPQLTVMLEAGWDPELDVSEPEGSLRTAMEPERRIILPGEL